MTDRKTLIVAAVVACVNMLGAARARAQSSASPGRSGRVDITSVDSITRLPLAGASVRLVAVFDTTRVHDAVLDARGRARVDRLPAGPWMLTARHARLDTLGVGSVAVPFTVRAGRGVTVRAAVPSVGTLVARVCGSAAAPGTGYLYGTVRRAVRTSASPRAAATDSALPLSAGQVTAQWPDLRIEAGRVERTIVTTDVPVGDNGRYVLCGVPTETTVRLRAVGAEGASGVATFTSSATGIVPRDLVLGRADTVVTTPSGPQAPEDSGLVDIVLRGAGGVRGTVQTVDGRPLANAIVGLSATGLAMRTDSAGRFLLAATPTGTWTLAVQALGYAPRQQPVDLVPGDTVALVVALVSARVMDTVQVRANAMARTVLGRNLVDFDERRKMGFGRFLTQDDFAKAEGRNILNLLTSRIPGMRTSGTGRRTLVSSRGPTSVSQRECPIRVIFDGSPNAAPLDLDSIEPSTIAAAEFYTPATLPFQFTFGFSPCGTLLLWSRW
ncbi:MAG: carboxypeptidase regulatory-like domain-containing protein [Gemmatimonas sp.]|uniref:carboxypeptidase regulatory-like domain-containing protein n=1 Tax=Gemmatimonas sp. TaxID=1962908 RepID=UPI0022C98F77|nr:carboxypeptidase regulatory-like domain-containing protein [Gemmatimonas sp.]MCZ8013898.1 carboxypeptidase regulatory-like domain-containing protein [Gemmatimonas sp.]MCZ8266469.1 carboxypeptidase regulatory-like domain-containing protein [Gemmatimonas sp.]